jgi:hypothetical protein
MAEQIPPNVGHLVEPGGGLRDAIHIAVIGIVAGETLQPGEHVFLEIENGRQIAYPGPTTDNAIGIVDPFLEDLVYSGKEFWLFLYPKYHHRRN